MFTLATYTVFFCDISFITKQVVIAPIEYFSEFQRNLAIARVVCDWLYAYPAFLRYAAHSFGGNFSRILAVASETAS